MKDEQLLRLSGDCLRESDALDDARFDELASGSLSPQGRDELLALERGGAVPAGAVEAFSPLSSEFLARLESKVVDVPPSLLVERGQEAAGRDANVRQIFSARRKRPWTVVMGAAIATAAAAALVLALHPSTQPAVSLPLYALEVEGGVAAVRAVEADRPSGEPVRLTPTTALSLRLRPQSKTGEKAAVVVFLVDPSNGTLRRLEVPSSQSESGVVTIRIAGQALLGTGTGERTLHLVVAPLARREALPSRAEDIAALPPEFQSFSLRLIAEE